MPFRSFLLLAIICLVWALNVVVSKLVVDDLAVQPMFYAALRALVVGVVLLPWLRPIPDNFLRVAFVTLALSGASFALLFLGLRYASPASAAVVNLTGAPLTLMFAILILREEIGWRRGLGIAFALAGVGIAIASPSAWDGSFGLIFVAASAALGALGSVLLKRIDLSPLRLQAWAGATSAAMLFPVSFATESGQLASTLAAGWPFLAALVFSSLVVSVYAHTAYFRMLQQYDANLIAPLTLMTPIFTIIAGAAITGDDVGPYLVLGALVAGAGVLIILVRPSRKLFKPLLVRPRF